MSDFNYGYRFIDYSKVFELVNSEYIIISSGTQAPYAWYDPIKLGEDTKKSEDYDPEYEALLV